MYPGNITADTGFQDRGQGMGKRLNDLGQALRLTDAGKKLGGLAKLYPADRQPLI